MNPEKRSMCSWLDDYLDACLNEQERVEFERHLPECQHCTVQIGINRRLGESISSLDELKLPDDADLRIRQELDRIVRGSSKGPDVMSIEEAAGFLGITVPELVGCLDELPAFEIAGRIRFNREHLIEWMKSRENDLAWEIRRDRSSSGDNLIAFYGGTSDGTIGKSKNCQSV